MNSRVLKNCLLIVALVFSLVACGNNRRFDSAAWLKADARERGRMADDLVKQGVLIGKSVDEAKGLLGAPDKDYGKALSYQIDLGWLFKDPKHYGLILDLDQNSYVREVRIVD
jgi:hypothetical protein